MCLSKGCQNDGCGHLPELARNSSKSQGRSGMREGSSNLQYREWARKLLFGLYCYDPAPPIYQSRNPRKPQIRKTEVKIFSGKTVITMCKGPSRPLNMVTSTYVDLEQMGSSFMLSLQHAYVPAGSGHGLGVCAHLKKLTFFKLKNMLSI